jgi:heme exporter protein CcmD
MTHFTFVSAAYAIAFISLVGLVLRTLFFNRKQVKQLRMIQQLTNKSHES